MLLSALFSHSPSCVNFAFVVNISFVGYSFLIVFSHCKSVFRYLKVLFLFTQFPVTHRGRISTQQSRCKVCVCSSTGNL